MHTRALRPLELGRAAPRRVLNITQKHSNNGDIRAVPSEALPGNQVVTGFVYQHAGAGGGLDLVALGVNETRLAGTLTTQPFLTAPLAPAFGFAGPADAWRNHDKGMLHALPRQNTPLRHGPGFLIHVWQGSSFAGSCSTTTLRSATSDDTLPARTTRPTNPGAPPPGPPPVDWSARFFYGVTGRPSTASPAGSAPPRSPARHPLAQVLTSGGSGYLASNVVSTLRS